MTDVNAADLPLGSTVVSPAPPGGFERTFTKRWETPHHEWQVSDGGGTVANWYVDELLQGGARIEERNT